jgi:hypothetical protein
MKKERIMAAGLIVAVLFLGSFIFSFVLQSEINKLHGENDLLSEKLEEYRFEISEAITGLDGEPGSYEEPPLMSISNTQETETADALEATTSGLKAQDSIIFTIKADQVSGMYGYQFELHYDKSKFKYDGGLVSSLTDLPVIFGTEMDDHALVGCTATGSASGVSGSNLEVCQVRFVALSDGVSAEAIKLRGVNVVGADQKYTEGVSGWWFSVAQQQ